MAAIATIGALTLLAGCGNDQPDTTGDVPATSTTTTGGNASTSTAVPGSSVQPVAVRATKVLDLGTAATALVTRQGSDVLYATEREGRVREIRRDGDGLTTGDVILDITKQVVEADGERGLLGLTFSPDGNQLFVSYTAGNDDGASVIESYRLDGAKVDRKSRREILRIPQPFANHNGGNIAFGPDGYLYAGYGDGGSQGDPNGNGQNRNVLLGKMLRLDVIDTPVGTPYRSPKDNPFVDGGGRPEVFAYGLRNPWRFSFDRSNGDLWIGDVGGSEWEEIDHVSAGTAAGSAGLGANFGWSLREGRHDTPKPGRRPDDLVEPVQEYSHDDGGCSVTGGVVVRDSTRLPILNGWYLFSDYCDRQLRAIPASSPTDAPLRLLTFDDGASPVSFTLDDRGDVYVVTLQGAIYRIEPT